MGLLDFLRSRPKNTATLARGRLLSIIITQERTAKDRPDYLPLLRRELLEVICKYVEGIDPNAIDIRVERDGDSEVLELSVALPEKPSPPLAAASN